MEEKKPQNEEWLEKEEHNLNTRQCKALFSKETWEKQKHLLKVAEELMKEVGDTLFMDYNLFREQMINSLKSRRVKSPAKPDKPIQTSEINQILNAVS